MMRILKNILKRLLGKPYMLYGYRNPGGRFQPNTRVSTNACLSYPHRLILEDNVFIGHFNFIEASNGIIIGEGCQITNYVSIISHSSHDSVRMYGASFQSATDRETNLKGSVSVGPYTFVGPHTTIMPGSTIGKGSIVSAYSYVLGDFPDFSVIAGNPAKVVGDTRKRDEALLATYPHLRRFYEKWAGPIPNRRSEL
jgi:acetyltransferase-like isoleucine patch superfamily enzyme